MIDNEKLRAALTLAADFTATAQAVSDAHAEPAGNFAGGA